MMLFDIFRGEKKGSIYPACSRQGLGGVSLLSVIRGTLSDLISYHFSQVSTPKQIPRITSTNALLLEYQKSVMWFGIRRPRKKPE